MGLQAQFYMAILYFLEVVFFLFVVFGLGGDCGDHFVDDVVEDFDLINADFDAIRQLILCMVSLFEPCVRCDLFQAVSQLRIRHQNVRDKALNLVADEASELVASIENFLVQALCVRVLERQVAADHCEKDYTCTP